MVLTWTKIIQKIKADDRELTYDEFGELLLLVENPCQDIDIDWDEKVLTLKGLNVEFKMKK